jgi:hypothetical protein
MMDKSIEFNEFDKIFTRFIEGLSNYPDRSDGIEFKWGKFLVRLEAFFNKYCNCELIRIGCLRVPQGIGSINTMYILCIDANIALKKKVLIYDTIVAFLVRYMIDNSVYDVKYLL